MKKPGEYTARVFDMIKSSLGVEKDAELIDETQFHIVEQEEEGKEENDSEGTEEAPKKDEL